MSTTEQELRQRHKKQKNETPTVEGDGGQDDAASSRSDGIGAIPLPEISRTQLAIIAVVVGAIIAWKLYQRHQDGDGGASLDDARETDWEPDDEIEGEERQEITVPNDRDKPLAGDEAVTEALLERGKIGGED